MARKRSQFKKIASCSESQLMLTIQGIRDAELAQRNREANRVGEMKRLSAERAAIAALDWLLDKQKKQVSANITT